LVKQTHGIFTRLPFRVNYPSSFCLLSKFMLASFSENGLLDFVRQFKPEHELVNKLAKIIQLIDEKL
jgi:hypothetical protein